MGGELRQAAEKRYEWAKIRMNLLFEEKDELAMAVGYYKHRAQATTGAQA
jgi:hypothetical protein